MRVGRYDIEQTIDGAVVRMRQTGRGAGMVGVAGAGLALSWYLGPFGPAPVLPPLFYWILTALLVMTAVGGGLAMGYREELRVGRQAVFWSSTFGGDRRVAGEGPLRMRVELASGHARRSVRVFPCEVVLLDPEDGGTPVRFLLQSESQTRRFLDILGERVALEVVEVVEEDAFRRRPVEDWLKGTEDLNGPQHGTEP